MALAIQTAGKVIAWIMRSLRTGLLPGRRFAASAAFVAAILIAGTGSASRAAELMMNCSEDRLAESPTVSCDFRFTEPQQLEELTLSANGQTIAGSTFTPYPGDGEKSAWLYLIDRSNPRRAATVRRNVNIAGRQLQTASGSRLIGLATFANELDLLLEPASRHVNIEQTLNSVQADGAATELFANSLKAIEILEKVSADRKALVIMSDGKAEDTAYSRQDVVDAARVAGVIIIGLGFAESNSETPALQELRRLAEETGGHFDAVVGDQAFAGDFAARLPRHLENGGKIRGPLGDISGEVTTTLEAVVAGGTRYAASQTLEVEAAPTPEPPKPLSTIARFFAATLGEDSSMVDWAEANQLLAWVVAALIPLLLLVAVVLWLRRRNAASNDELDDGDIDETETPSTIRTDALDGNFEDGNTRVVAAAGSGAFGYFEIVGSEDRPFHIETHSVSIGRHSDNDFVLTNDSVHRHHAHFHISPNGAPTITDLDTANGMLINGVQVGRADLVSGDLIELGEVRLRYIGE